MRHRWLAIGLSLAGCGRTLIAVDDRGQAASGPGDAAAQATRCDGPVLMGDTLGLGDGSSFASGAGDPSVAIDSLGQTISTGWGAQQEGLAWAAAGPVIVLPVFVNSTYSILVDQTHPR